MSSLILRFFCIQFSRFENGDGEIRTLDPLLARQVLSQLSYTPELVSIYHIHLYLEVSKSLLILLYLQVDSAATYSPISSPT